MPGGDSLEAALAGATHLAIGAHQDDLEIMAWHGIEAGGRFVGVVCTDGGGSSRTGKYAHFTDAEMRTIRAAEQEAAARAGGYAALVQLAHASASVKDAASAPLLAADLAQLFAHARPEILYTHQPADKHATHRAVFRAVWEALRALPPEQRPARWLGCEVWRDLDWLDDAAKVRLPLRDLAAREELIALFDSQIAGGKRYDLAATGRARANAVFSEAHAPDAAAGVWFALDCTPLLAEDAPDPADFLAAHLTQFTTTALADLRAAFA